VVGLSTGKWRLKSAGKKARGKVGAPSGKCEGEEAK